MTSEQSSPLALAVVSPSVMSHVQPYALGVDTSSSRLLENTSTATTTMIPNVAPTSEERTGSARRYRPRSSAKCVPAVTVGGAPMPDVARAAAPGRLGSRERVASLVIRVAATPVTTTTATSTTSAPTTSGSTSIRNPGEGSASLATPIGNSGDAKQRADEGKRGPADRDRQRDRGCRERPFVAAAARAR